MGNKTTLTLLLISTFCLGGTTQAESFQPTSAITSSTSASDLNPVTNLIQGAGVGFDAVEPHDQIAFGADGLWTTAAPGGFPSDYIEDIGMPVLVIDLGIDTNLNEISVWGNSTTNANGASEIALLFASHADGTRGFGTSITFSPTFFPSNSHTPRQSFLFGQTVRARFVEVTIVDNFFVAPGDGSGGGLVGGDRVALGEIAFAEIGFVEATIFSDGFESGNLSVRSTSTN